MFQNVSRKSSDFLRQQMSNSRGCGRQPKYHSTKIAVRVQRGKTRIRRREKDSISEAWRKRSRSQQLREVNPLRRTKRDICKRARNAIPRGKVGILPRDGKHGKLLSSQDRLVLTLYGPHTSGTRGTTRTRNADAHQCSPRGCSPSPP